MLATPGPNGDAVLETAIVQAAEAGLVAPRGHVVVLQQVHDDFCVKVRGCMGHRKLEHQNTSEVGRSKPRRLVTQQHTLKARVVSSTGLCKYC